ncbi:MAG: Asp-tRNA(Asn)/Glu-tRNA(Gln) amidotransferase subunit GatB, partial [Desulfobacterales bacterium]|nr:Asp-tRNA(Asn)/Glu-tRNA(Gln) amidotransferase subunit GatB [Desulfobacterales bacterium]
RSLVDLNRAGTPLTEIVSEPDIHSPEEAGAYLRQLRSIVRYLGICDGNMEEGSFRCDANISLRPKGTKGLGTRTELKNLNSFRHVEKALHYEIQRQESVLSNGQEVIQETRLWDETKNRTFSMRGKEDAHDYRYFPEPDLKPLTISQDRIEQIQQQIPELPDQKKQRFIHEYELPAYDAMILTTSRELADYFESCVQYFHNPKQISNWIMGPLLGILNTQSKSIEQSPVTAKNLAGLVQLIEEGLISNKIAKTVFDDMVNTGLTAKEIVEKQGLVQVTDTKAIEDIITQVLRDNPSEVTAYKNGKTKLMGFFVGQIMKVSKGKANPQIVNQLLKDKLESNL